MKSNKFRCGCCDKIKKEKNSAPVRFSLDDPDRDEIYVCLKCLGRIVNTRSKSVVQYKVKVGE